MQKNKATELNTLLKVAQTAAKSAAQLLLEKFRQPQKLSIANKGYHDIVTDADRQAELCIIKTIAQHYPEHSILGEESGSKTGSSYCWIIDPIDGTVNFARGVPQFCISIALKKDEQFLLGLVYDPTRDELFTAIHQQGAWLNQQPIKISQQTSLENALLATGFPSKQPEKLATYLAGFKQLFPPTLGVRRGGSAALDLAYIAAGRFDGFWEFDLKIWDIAAGIVLLAETGGVICDLTGGENYPEKGVIAGTPKVVTAMRDRLSSNSAHP